MSIESSNDTPVMLHATSRRAAFLLHPTSDPVKAKDFVAFFPGSDRYVIRVASESLAFGQVTTGRLTMPGSDCPVDVVYLYGGGAGGTGGPSVISGSMVGTDLVLALSDSSTVTVDLSTAFDDTNLARVVSATLAGSIATFTRDDASTFDLDLSTLNAGNPVVSGTVAGTDLVLTLQDTSTVTVDLSTFIDDTNLPRIISAAVTGSDVTFERDDSSTFTVDMSAFLDDTNLARVVSGAIVGTDIVLTRDDASTVAIDVSALGTVQTIQNTDNALLVTNPSGPTVDVDLVVSPDTGNVLEKRANGVYANLEGYDRFRGFISAATGTLPTDARVGDWWWITEEGDNFGNIEIINYLHRGDAIQYLDIDGNGNNQDPQNWAGWNRNIDERLTGNVTVEATPQVVNLPANTPVVVPATELFFGEIRRVEVFDENNFLITSGVSIQIAPGNGTTIPPTATLISNNTLNNVTVTIAGDPDV